MTDPAIALLLWGDVFEDYLDTIGVSLNEYEFWSEGRGGWLFGYIEGLDQVSIRVVLVVWSREARRPHQRSRGSSASTDTPHVAGSL